MDWNSIGIIASIVGMVLGVFSIVFAFVLALAAFENEWSSHRYQLEKLFDAIDTCLHATDHVFAQSFKEIKRMVYNSTGYNNAQILSKDSRHYFTAMTHKVDELGDILEHDQDYDDVKAELLKNLREALKNRRYIPVEVFVAKKFRSSLRRIGRFSKAIVEN